jgi:hypothetical protein
MQKSECRMRNNAENPTLLASFGLYSDFCILNSAFSIFSMSLW